MSSPDARTRNGCSHVQKASSAARLSSARSSVSAVSPRARSRSNFLRKVQGDGMTDARQYGVHSEVGQLRKVLVCAPGLAHERLTPTNSDALLFDDVMWVQNARRDHFDFVDKMRARGVEVVELHELLAETMENADARAWLLDRKIVPNEVGFGLVDDTRAFLEK